MAQTTITKGNHTIQTIKSHLSTLGYTKIWTGSDKTRVYLNGAIYAEIVGDTIVVGDKLRTLSSSASNAANLLAASDDAIVTVPTAPAAQPVLAKQISAADRAARARAWDNLYNEGYRDGGYNPYRRN